MREAQKHGSADKKQDPANNYTTGVCTLSYRTADDLFRTIGRLPPLLRQLIRSFVLAKGFSQGDGWVAGEYDRLTGQDFWFAGNFGASWAVWAFSVAYVGQKLNNDQWNAAVANDTCVVDEESANAANNGSNIDAAITATMLATYQALVGPWPKDVSCMQNQLMAINSTASWQSFGFPEIGLCHNLLDPGGLPSRRFRVSE